MNTHPPLESLRGGRPTGLLLLLAALVLGPGSMTSGSATAESSDPAAPKQDASDAKPGAKTPAQQAKDLEIDLQVPGEEKPPEGRVDDEHPWTVVEKLPVMTDPRGAVGVYHRDSPRSLLWSFGRALDAYRELLQEEGRTCENQADLKWIQSRIATCFDLDGIAPEFRNSIATDAAVLLRGVIRRVPLPAWEDIPNKAEIDQMSEGEKIKTYRFRDVPIELIQTESGEHAGEWVISKRTRQNAAAAFERVSDLQPIAAEGDLIELHFMHPGWMISPTLIKNLPEWANAYFYKQALWQWILAMVAITVIVLMLLVLFIGLSKAQKRIRSRIRLELLTCIGFNLAGIIALSLNYLIEHQIMISGIPLEAILMIFTLISMLCFVLAILSASMTVAELIISSPAISSRGLDAAFTRVIARSTGILIAIVLIFKTLSQLGFSPTTLLAGASVTGLAFALAAQTMLKNFFASITLLTERPFREGDLIQIGEDRGIVETIGLRSTCIRVRDGNLVYLPNSEIAHGRIENVSRRPHIRCELTLGVTYDTSCEKIAQATEIVKAVLQETIEPPRSKSPKVYFTDFGDSALAITVTYWQSTTDYDTSRQKSHDANLEILDRFRKEGIELAFPTMTVKIDEGSDDAPPARKLTDQDSPNAD
ncbi:MAG: mechanosensitive ion channel domain-containing protein [Planctomycetota bacterium]|nr:mechanosensitive ion channel domain-containing protein [Planctomycetota bacterium]